VKVNKVKAKLKAGETVIGPYVRYADCALAEILCQTGYDFLLFDSEHAPIEDRDCENLARVCEARGISSIARVPTNQTWMISRRLDTGIEGLLIPMVNSAAEAEAAIRAAKYAPDGIRGLAGARAANYGMTPGFHYADHVRTCNEETLMILQVETPQSIDALPEIVKVPGVDVIFIGPTDLSLSLGHPGHPEHPDVQAAFQKITDIVLKSGKALGILTISAQDTLEWRRRGATFILSVFESIMVPAIRGYLKTSRGE
jgi:4-hydroxy-2-oxoheptanedioate aldolase